MKCPNCSQPVEQSAVFCGNCGFQLQQNQPAPSQAIPAQSPAYPTAPIQTLSPSVAPVSAAAPIASNVAPLAPALPVAPIPVAPGFAQAIPAYALGQAQAAPDSKYLTWAVVCAAASIPAALIPLLGLALGITALVLAIKHHHAGTGRLVTSVVIGSVGIILALGAWAYNVSQLKQQTGLAPTHSVTASVAASTRGVDLYKSLIDVSHPSN